MDGSKKIGITPLKLSFDTVKDAEIFLNSIDEYRDLLSNICFSNGYSECFLCFYIKYNLDAKP